MTLVVSPLLVLVSDNHLRKYLCTSLAEHDLYLSERHLKEHFLTTNL